MSPSDRETDRAIGNLQGSLAQISGQIQTMHSDQRNWQDGHTNEDRASFTRIEQLIRAESQRTQDRMDAGLATMQGQITEHGKRLDQAEGRQALLKWVFVPLSFLVSLVALIWSMVHGKSNG